VSRRPENTADKVLQHACKLGLESIVLKRKDFVYRSGCSTDGLKFKNPAALAVKREAEEDWGRSLGGPVKIVPFRHPYTASIAFLAISTRCCPPSRCSNTSTRSWGRRAPSNPI
jgi:hypothetical protein